MSGAFCSFFMFFAFTSACGLQYLLTDGASTMQMICSIFNVLGFLSVVFCGLGLDFVE